MGVLALASCVVLTGCGNKTDEAKIVIKDLPTNLVEGGSIDLKDYITVSGGNGGGYSINFDDESFAKITKESETKIILNEYGNVNFTVSYSGKTQDGTIVVGSEFYNSFIENVKNAGYDYGLIYFDEYDDPHWENYGERFIIDSYYSEDGYGGYLVGNDGNVYTFEETFDAMGEPVFSFSITGVEPNDLSLYSKPLSLPTSGYKVSKEVYEDESYSVLILNETEDGQVRDIFLNFFGYDEDSLDEFLDAYDLVISSLQIVENPIELNDGSVIMSYDAYAMVADNDETSPTYGQESYITDQMIVFDKDYMFKEDVENYIKNDGQPKSSFAVNVDAIADAVEKHNYQIDYSAYWYECSPNKEGTALVRGDKLNYNPFYDEETADQDSYGISDHFNAIGTFSAYVSESKTMVDVPNGPAYGLAEYLDAPKPEEITAWDYNYNPSTDKYETGSKEKSDTGYSLFHDGNLLKFYNFEFLSGKEVGEYGDVYSSMFINSCEEGKNVVTYKLSSKTCLELFNMLFYASIYDGEEPAATDWRPSSYKNFSAVSGFIFGVELIGGLYLSDIFDVTIVENYSSDGENLESISFEFVWTDVIEAGQNYEYYEYVMTANVDFTKCDMPDFTVVFPTTK